MRRIAIAFVALAVVSTANADVRTDVGGIAASIEANYYDAKRAAAIANDLRASAQAGDLDRFTERADLASELTQRLRKLDGHFSVIWRPHESRPQAQTPAPRPAPLPESRTNYGFRRVERLPGNIGYIDLEYEADIDFSQADSPQRRAADTALAMVRDADAVIIDLRTNGGGAPSMVGYIVSAFIDAKANVYNTFHWRQGASSERPAVGYATPMHSVPLFVLTSGRTGSAGEAIAFTLQAAKRARVVGERSAGAANPGEAFETPEGYSVFIATGSPRNPINGRNWEGEGVKPDVEVAAASAVTRAQELALEEVLKGRIAGASRTDAQWTLEALRAGAKQSSSQPAADVAGTFGSYSLAIENGVLQMKRARWPGMTLLPISADLYYFEENPSRRVSIVRENGKVAAIEMLDADGSRLRLPKRS